MTTDGCGNCDTCEQGVARANGESVQCPLFCLGPEECKCAAGYFQNPAGQCVLLSDCPAPIVQEPAVIVPPSKF